ncbi:Two pore calcium channel protein 1B (Voltage-dependent calcium channel protein TPC1B) (NtTPC1B), partial [Durusdinium trenchii]
MHPLRGPQGANPLRRDATWTGDERLKHYVTEPKAGSVEDGSNYDIQMLVRAGTFGSSKPLSTWTLGKALVLVEPLGTALSSAYTLNNQEPPAWTGYVELVFSFVYLVEVAVKVKVRSWRIYWLSLPNRFDFFTTFLLLFSSLLPYLPNSVLPFDLRHYANILRLLRLLRVIKQLKSLRSVQFLAGAVTKMVWAAGNILLMLGCVVFFFSTLGVNLFGGVLYKGNPGLEHTEYEEKHWFVFNFNDTPMAFALFFTQLLCEYVPTNAEALQKTSRYGDVAWLIFPLFYFLGVAIMFEILLAFSVEAYIELREENEKEEEEEMEREEEEQERAEGSGGVHGQSEGHGHESHQEHRKEEEEEENNKFERDSFFEEVQEKFEEKGQVVHYIAQDEPNFPKLLREAFEKTLEEHHSKPHAATASHLEIAKAAWQTENAMFHTEWEKYPEDCAAARRDHFRLLRANKTYYKAIIALVVLTFCEVPPWCHQRSPNQDLWRFVPPEEWCHVPDAGHPYLSNIWYIPPGIGLIIEMIIEIIILRKFLLNWQLERTHFKPIGVQYHNSRLITAGLIFAVGSLLDTILFTFTRMPMRFTWIFRTGLLFILPGVQRVYTLIFNRRMIGEFASVAVFFVGTVMFFAWVTVTIFKDLDSVAYQSEEVAGGGHRESGVTFVLRASGRASGWNGDPSTWLEFKQAARLYVASTKIESRYTCGPKIAAELSGAAKTAIMGKKAHWLSDASGVETLLKHLQVTIGEPALPEVGNFLRLYFKTLRRQKGESMTAFCVRHREEYEKMCRSLARMIKEQKKDMNLRSSAMPSSSQATESGSVQGGHEGLNDPNSQEATSHSWGDNEPWTNWNGMLLEKSGLDGLEKSIIQGEIKGNFTLSGVENALRAHWGDDAIKKRDGEAKHSLFQEDLEGDEPSPHDEEEAYFEGWADHEIAWYQEAKNDEQKAWIQFQGAKRTLREARARQHEVKMSRKFYKTTYPIGAGKNFQNRGAPPTKGPCFLCGERGHVKSECPKRQSAQYAEEEEVEQVHHTFHTTFMTQDEDIVASSHGDNYFFEETYGEGSTALEPEEVFHASTAYISTEAAVYQGKAILDGGATRTMGSLFALERYMHNMQEAHGTDGIKEISTSEVD